VELFICGPSHKMAPLEIRENLAFTGHLFDQGLAHLLDFVDEAVLLSTCSRAEVCAVAQQQEHALQAMRELVAARGIPWENTEGYIYIRYGTEALSDGVIGSTGAPHPVIGRHHMEEAGASRGCRHLPVVDIAVPRDEEPGMEDIKWLHLIKAKAFLAWLSHRTMAVLATSHLLERIERLGLQELDRLHRKVGGFTPAQSRHVAAFFHRILGQVLHEPLVRMRELAASGDLEGLGLIAGAFGAGEEQ